MNIKKPLPISLVSLLEHSPLLVASVPSFLASNENVSGTRGSTMEETEITIKSIEFDVKENKD